ncbi:R-spondin-1 [Gracilinanus agilis]|uniref:R-spondin-1 n=1 Tax=Gracilinanus agilis TaxID=191870 RepID=UPI001CFD2C51|nr:R-spondin-1 [Gracilinanus agilis]
MRLGLLVVALILSWMHLAGSNRGLKGKRQRRRQKRRKDGQGRRENANGNLSRKESKEARLGSPRRRKGQQPPPPQHRGTEGPLPAAGPA